MLKNSGGARCNFLCKAVFLLHQLKLLLYEKSRKINREIEKIARDNFYNTRINPCI